MSENAVEKSSGQPLPSEELFTRAGGSASYIAATNIATIKSSMAKHLFQRLFMKVGPAVFFLALAIATTYPLINHLSDGIIRHPIISRSVDVDAERWNLWWFKTAVVARHANPFSTDLLYYPFRDASNPLSLYFNDMHPLDMFLAMPVVALATDETGPTISYNLLTLFHLTFTGLGFFWLVRYLSRSAPAALVAGTLFVLSPLDQYELDAGHLVLLAMGWMLLQIQFLHRLFFIPEGEKPRRLYAVLAVLFLLATSFTNWYLTVFTLLVDALMAVVALFQRRREWRRTVVWGTAVLAGWLALISPFLYVTIRSMSDPALSLAPDLNYDVSLSLSPIDLITWSKDWRVWPALWKPGTLGYVALALAAIGLRWGRKRKQSILWAALVVTGCVLALGPYLKLDSGALDVASTTGIPLPYLLLRSLPFMDIARAPQRFVLLADTGIAVLAGYGVAYLSGKMSEWQKQWVRPLSPGPRQTGLVIALLAAMVLELATLTQPVSAVRPSPFFSQLRSDGGNYAILELPVTGHYALDHNRMFNQTIHHKSIIGGYLSRWVEDYYRQPGSPFGHIVDMSVASTPDIIPRLPDFVVLNYYNIKYIVYYKQSISYKHDGDRRTVEGYIRSLYQNKAAAIYEDAELVAYQVPPTPGADFLVWPGDGWYPAESQKMKVWRWSAGQSSIFVATKAPRNVRILFAAATLKGGADLEILSQGRPVRSIHISNVDTQVDSGEISLPPGESEIVLRSDTPPISPVQAGISKSDERPLGFVVHDFQVLH